MSAPTADAPAGPLAPVEAPPVRPVGFGLLAAASVTTLTGDAAARAGLFGVEWVPPPCRPANRWPANCDGPFPPGGKIIYDREDRAQSDPFGVYYAEECAPVGLSEDLGARARAGLAQGESRPVEQELWDYFDRDGAVTDNGPGRGLADTLGHLEEELGNRSGSLGVIHAPSRVAAHAAAANLLRYDGPVPRTPRGHAWVFGDGYDPARGNAGIADGVRLVATGPVWAWRTDVTVTGPFFDHSVNLYVALAERTYVVGWNCAAVAMATPLSP